MNLPSARQSAPHMSNQRRFSNNNFCFSRVSPLQKQRIEQVDMIEKALKKHPLALYPHLEECVPPEVILSTCSLSTNLRVHTYQQMQDYRLFMIIVNATTEQGGYDSFLFTDLLMLAIYMSDHSLITALLKYHLIDILGKSLEEWFIG